MKKLFVILASVLALTGCASGCQRACVFGIGPGNPIFDSYADNSDVRDPCQFKGKPADYKLPNFCGASKGKVFHVTKGIGRNDYIVDRY